jgi:hypothetical protein
MTQHPIWGRPPRVPGAEIRAGDGALSHLENASQTETGDDHFDAPERLMPLHGREGYTPHQKALDQEAIQVPYAPLVVLEQPCGW